MKITKRDNIFFITAIITMFLIKNVSNWKNIKSDFQRGWNDGYKFGSNK